MEFKRGSCGRLSCTCALDGCLCSLAKEEALVVDKNRLHTLPASTLLTLPDFQESISHPPGLNVGICYPHTVQDVSVGVSVGG